MKISAVIFDLNGTVVADEGQWGSAYRSVLERLGVKVEADYPHVGGIGVEENWPLFIKRYGIKTKKTKEELAVETIKEYLKNIDKIELKKGFKYLVADLNRSGIKVALSTSSTWNTVEAVLDNFGIENYFDSITTGEEVSEKKPSPQIFELAAQKLGIKPGECLVFEDSEAGIEAAHAAGMAVIGLFRDEEHKKTLEEADGLIKDFDDVNPEMLKSLSN